MSHVLFALQVINHLSQQPLHGVTKPISVYQESQTRDHSFNTSPRSALVLQQKHSCFRDLYLRWMRQGSYTIDQSSAATFSTVMTNLMRPSSELQ